VKKRKSRGGWTTLGRRVVYRNPWFVVRKDVVTRPDGKPGAFHVIETKGAAVFIVALNARNEVLLVKLFRYPTERWSVEVPGGNSEGQRPLAAAKRELEEETGWRARRWKKIGSFQSVNGLSSELSYVYLATSLERTGRDRQAEEGIVGAFFVPFARALRDVAEGRITDGKTVCALAYAALAKRALH